MPKWAFVILAVALACGALANAGLLAGGAETGARLLMLVLVFVYGVLLSAAFRRHRPRRRRGT